MCSQYMMENILGINLFHIHEQKASPITSQKAQQKGNYLKTSARI